MFSKILIANRGEIAVRIIRACRELGIQTVAVYSEADKEALHTEMADEAICIGPARSSESYLNMQEILSAAIVTNAEAIHPGFGFLSENSCLQRCVPNAISNLSDQVKKPSTRWEIKIHARQLMQEAGVPVIPGSDGAIDTLEEAEKLADKIGYPVMLKAAAGGGGKGIRKVPKKSELEKHFYLRNQKLKQLLAMMRCTWKKLFTQRAILRCRFLGISRVRSFI